MSLIKCPECGKEISNKAKCCIYCGYPLEEMKKQDIKDDDNKYSICLTDIGTHKIEIIKLISKIAKINISEAKIFIEHPNFIKTNILLSEANSIKEQIEKINGKAIIVPYRPQDDIKEQCSDNDLKINDEYVNSEIIHNFIKKWQISNAINYIMTETNCTQEQAEQIVNKFKTTALQKSTDSVDKWKQSTVPETVKITQDYSKPVNKTIITCPYCGSNNTKRISSVSRISSVLTMGIFSKKIGKEWHCNNCNSNF